MELLVFYTLLSVAGIWAQSHHTDDIPICLNETSIDSTGKELIWNAFKTDIEIPSSPLCLDEVKFLKTRKCSSDGWIPEDPYNCSSSQISYDESNNCPLNYQHLKWNNQELCVLLTADQSWNNTCLATGSSETIFDLDNDERKMLENFLVEKSSTRIWLPAKQLWDHSPIVWTLPGKNYGEAVQFEKLSLKVNVSEYVSKGCLSLVKTGTRYEVFLEDCTLKMPILCVYKEKPLIQLACPESFYTTRYEKHQEMCYSTHMILNLTKIQKYSRNSSSMMWVSSECRGELYTMNSVEKTLIYDQLGQFAKLDRSDRCLFGVARNTYIASENQWNVLAPSIKFVNWAIPSGKGSVITADERGKWHWTSNVFSCIACQRRLDQLRMPEIDLVFDAVVRKLFLIVFDAKYLWREDEIGVKCFTNSDHELIRSVKIDRVIWNGTLVIDGTNNDLVSNAITKTVLELKTYGDGPGYYWCEGFAIPHFQFIETKKVVAYREVEGEVFAMKVERNCFNSCDSYLQESYSKELARNFKNVLNDLKSLLDFDITIENVRLMQIDSIDRVNQTMNMIFHVTVTSDIIENVDEIEEYLSNHTIRIFHLNNILSTMLLEGRLLDYKIISINSTEYCLPSGDTSALNWRSTRIGDTIAPEELCLLGNGLPVLRECSGDFLYGGEWRNLTRQHCNINQPSIITKNLFEIERSFISCNETSIVIEMVRDLIANHTQLMPADLYYLSKIMSKINLFNNDSSSLLTRNEFNNIFAIYNSLMQVNENITKTSAALNTTNILLDAFDTIVNNLPTTNITLTNFKLTENLDDGTIAIITPKLVMYAIDPSVRNISGIALFKNQTKVRQFGESDDFTDYNIRTIFTNQSSHQLLEEIDLEIGSFVPQALLDRLQEIRIHDSDDTLSPPRIVITVYYNDNLFQEFKNVTYAKPGGKIISVSIPGYGPMLPVLLPIFIRTDNFTDQMGRDTCGYWKLKKDEGWGQDGCDYNGYSNFVVLCTCSHLTHFAYLILGTYVHSISIEDDMIITQFHQQALDIITLLGCSLSLLGILGIYVTAIIFPFWREKPSSKVLLHLSTAIALQMILLCFVNTAASSSILLNRSNLWGCVILGSLLHYSVLVAFSWMLITAYLQFMRYVRVLGQTRCSRFFLKSFICGWIVPLFPVMIVALLFPNSYIPDLNEYPDSICYPSGLALHLGVVFPIALIICANLVIFIVVLWNIIRGPDGNMRTSEKDLTLSQLRLSILLFFLLGLTWFFGLLATTRAGLAFSYLFCLIATLQGFVLFLYFIILDPVTRNLWNLFLKKHIFCNEKPEFY